MTVTLKKQRISPRQAEILRLISGGENSKTIAALLGISILTVNSQRKSIVERLNCRNMNHAVAKFARL